MYIYREREIDRYIFPLEISCGKREGKKIRKTNHQKYENETSKLEKKMSVMQIIYYP